MKNIKLGRTARLVLGVGAFVIILGTLFMVYSRQSGEQEELERNLATAQTQLVKLISGRTAFESQLAEQEGKLAEAQAAISTARRNFPGSAASIEYDEMLKELANFNNLKVISMTAKEPRDKKVGDVTFVTVAFDVEVRGEVNSILGLVSDIATDERFASATVEMVSIDVPEGEVGIGEEPEAPTGTIELVGYSYGGE
jgi:hypothetical protein